MDYNAIADYVDYCLKKWIASNLESLNENEKVVLLTFILDAEIMMNGLHGFFFNSSANHVFEIIPALKKIGASDAADYVEQSARLFGSDELVRNEQDRIDRFVELKDTQDFWDTILYYQELYHSHVPSVQELIDDYVNKLLIKAS